MMNVIILLLSLLIGSSFIISFLINKKIKNKSLSYFATSLSFVIILSILVLDIIPEIIKLTSNYSSIGLTLCAEFVGIITLVIIDLLIPMHEHKHKANDENKKEHKNHLYHIGSITFFSVIFHNILRGIAFYLIAKTSLESALMMALGLFLYNLSLGLEISCFLDIKSDKSKKLILLTVSVLIGSIIGLILGSIGDITNLIFLSIACGMMLYLGLLELGVETFNNRKEKGIIEGLLVGAIITALLLL